MWSSQVHCISDNISQYSQPKISQQVWQIKDISKFSVHPDTWLIVREWADVYTLFPWSDIIELEVSLKMYVRKIELNQNDFDHATQIFSYLYLHGDSQKRHQYLECFSHLYEKILTGRFDERLKQEIISFSQIFLQQVQTTSKVRAVLETQ